MGRRSAVGFGLVVVAGALIGGCSAEVDRAAPPATSPSVSGVPGGSGVSGPPGSPGGSVVTRTPGAGGPTATSVPGTEMTPPVDRNVCGRVRTATNEYSPSYENAPQSEKSIIGKKWSGFIRDRAAEATDARLREDLEKLAAEVDSWKGGEADNRAYTTLINQACTRYAA